MNNKKRASFTLAFKQDASKLILEQHYTYPQASKSLGVSESALRRWVDAERGGIKAGPTSSGLVKTPLSLSEHDELLRLRKENIRLKMEREILKKAAVFFAKEAE